MLKKIITALASIIIVFVIVVATRPAGFRPARSTTIAAPATVVFEQVNDLRQWDAWSPWTSSAMLREKIEPLKTNLAIAA